MEISKEKVEELLELVRKHFPGWDSFNDERFMKEEITYKRNAVSKAQEMLNREGLKQLVEQRNFDEFIRRLEKIGRATNLLWTAVPMSGDLKVLYQKNLDKESFCSEVFDLIHGAEPADSRFKRYIDYVRNHDMPDIWPFPTYFLFLCHTDSEMFVRPSVTKWFLDFIGAKEEFTPRPSSSCYLAIKLACQKLRGLLEGYGAKDMVDIQSVIWVGASVSRESKSQPIKSNREEEFVRLFKEFSSSYPNTIEGQRHIPSYERGREEARRNYLGIVSSLERGEDITDSVLLKLLPYADSDSNRAKGAWIPIAPSITGDLKAWFGAKRWARPEDWPEIAKAILQFVRQCNDDPSQLASACKEFSALPYAKGFQTGMLTPILNALRPDDFIIVNNKSRQVINYLTQASFHQSLGDYPSLNRRGLELIEELAPRMREVSDLALSDNDLFDMFCHWVVAVKRHDLGKARYWKISPGENAWNWEACRDGGFIAIGWDELGDLSGLSRKEFDSRWAEVAPQKDGWTKTPSNQVWNFVNLREGDKIIANEGTTQVLGLGVVTGEYCFVPNVRHGHRVPVDWYDVQKRPVKKDGWRKTIIKLSEDEFREIEQASGRPGDGLFSTISFDLLTELHKNPTQDFYRSKREDFKRYIEEPAQRVLKKVAANLPSPMLDLLETEKKIFGKIPKNDWGKGGAWDYYWGAFYPKGGKRTEDAQLFLWINRDVVRFGFYIGEYGSMQRERFLKNCRQNAAALEMALKDSLPIDLAFSAPYDSSKSEKELIKTSFANWIGDPGKLGIDAAVMLNRAAAEQITETELVERVSDTFKSLFPFVILATSDDPMPRIAEYLETEPPQPQPPYTLARCAEETRFDEDELARWVRAIERKGQAILYGPPGTGKTYVAERLARHLVGGGDGFIDILQFHPAYAYEDFIQGIRPRSRPDGGLEYPIVEGRFLEFCRSARAVTGRCVLIIDEINRANLSRVFGELMYLLEYRTAKIPLATGGEFQIPANIRIIGTMNTADRSIALVDHALRRRFAFIPLYPNYEVLKGFHQETGFDPEGLISVLRRLNSQIGDPHYEVGITFFLREDIAGQISDVWRMEIEPYLEEYFFDQRKKADEFRWEQVRKEILPVGD